MSMERKRKQGRGGSAIGWIVFAVIVAGGPLLNALQSILGIRIPSFVLPAIVALAVLASVVGSLVKAFGNGTRQPGDMRYPMPEETPPIVQRPITPMPPFGGELSAPVWIPPQSDPAEQHSGDRRAPVPPVLAPRFEPVISGIAILVGIVGLIALAGLAVILLFPAFANW